MKREYNHNCPAAMAAFLLKGRSTHMTIRNVAIISTSLLRNENDIIAASVSIWI